MATVGIIGTGPTADVHRDRYERIDGVEALESVTVDETDRLRTVIDTADAVDVCSPPSTHRTAVEAALDRNVDVLCTPPIGGDMDDATAIARAAADSDGVVLAGHVPRFSPGQAGVRDSVRDGSVGELGVVRVTRSVPAGRADERHDWYADDGGTRDVLIDFALHDFDYLRWMVGDVERVFTRFRDGGEVEHAVTLVRFSNGATAHVETTYGSLPELGHRVEMDVAGDEGVVQYDTAEAAAFERIDTSATAQNSYAEPPLTDGEGRDGYYHMLDHFVTCVEDGQRPSVTAEDGMQALRLATAARRSAESGRPVAVEEVES